MDPTQEALQAAQDNIDDASRLYNDATSKLDEFRSGPSRPADDATTGHDIGGKQWDETFKARQTSWEQARAQMATANKAYADLTSKLAVEYEIKQRSAKDPNEQQLWANEAEKAHAQADLYGSQASMYQAKTQADIDNATTRAQSALTRANTYAQRVPSQNALSDAQAALAGAKLAYLPALSQSTIDLHRQQIETGRAHASLYAAQADRTEAQANLLIPAQAAYYVQRGLLTQAQAEQLARIGPVKADELEAKLGLDKARADQIRANIGKYQILPNADSKSPTLTEFQPSTGQTLGVPNPSYVVPETQAIKDYYSSIDYIQQQISSGAITPQDGDTLMANLKTSLDARTKGFTPEAYQQAQQQQADFGRGVLGGMQSQGDTMANQLLGAANRARDPSAFAGMTPYTNAQDMAGGPDAIRQAFSLIGQIKPITDRSSALDAASRYKTAANLLRSSTGDTSTDATTQPASQPAQSPPPAPVAASNDDQQRLLQAASAAGLGAMP